MSGLKMLKWLGRLICRSSVCKGVILGTFIVYIYIHSRPPESGDAAFGKVVHERSFKDESNFKASKNISIQMPSNKALENDWVQVNGSNKDVFLYSAYYDTRAKGEPTVRLIAILRRRYRISKCQIWTKNGVTISSVATVKYIRENWSMKYIASFVICKGFKVPPDDSVASVAVILPNTLSLQTMINVTNTEDAVYEGEFSVCVKPFHYNYNRAVWLVEFVELHRILGVQKFFFYNHTVGNDVEAVLQYYIEQNVVEINPWTLPVQSQKEIRTEGIFAALNDCNMKNVGRFTYVIMIDLDEYILPKKLDSYPALVESLGRKSAYVFQNAFFYLYWDNDTSAEQKLYGSPESLGSKRFGSEVEGPYLLTAYKTTRLTKLHRHGQRSKYIAMPTKAIECGNHLVWEFAGPKNSLNVKPEDAIVHHYRICEYGGFDCLTNKHEVDLTAHKWLPSLVESVAETCSSVFSKGLCPPAPPLGSPW